MTGRILGNESALSLVDLLVQAGEAKRSVTLVHAGDQEEIRSYTEIMRNAQRKAAGLRTCGLKQGQVVVLVMDTSFAFVETFFGVLLAGGVPSPAYPPVAMSRLTSYVARLRKIVDATQASFLVTTSRIRRMLGELSWAPTLNEILVDDRLYGNELVIHYPASTDIALIQCTSGSTSNPKPVVLRHRHLISNIQGFGGRLGWREEDVTVSWLPLYHDLGLIGALLGSIRAKSKLVLISPTQILMDIGIWWRAMARHRATMTGGPNFIYGLSGRRMSAEEIAQLDLSHARVLLCGAEPINPTTIREFFRAFSSSKLSPRSFVPAYGLAESCVGVSCISPNSGMRTEVLASESVWEGTARELPEEDNEDSGTRSIDDSTRDLSIESVCLGAPFGDLKIEIRDPQGHVLPDRAIGEVWAHGSSIMDGYMGMPEATAEVLESGWLRTGDSGYQVDGELYLLGRLKHMLVVRGRNFYAEAIEATAEEVPGVRRGNVVAFGIHDAKSKQDSLVLVVETRVRENHRRKALQREIIETVREVHGLTPLNIVFVPPGTVPKTSSGKRRRNECRELYLSAQLERPESTRTGVVSTLVRSQLGFVAKAVRRAV